MQQTFRPGMGPVHAKLSLPGSKSITYRALLLAALAEGVSEITGVALNDDLRTFTHALNQLGIQTQLDESAGSVIVAGGNGRFPKKEAAIWCGDAEVLSRFLIAACAATPGVYYFDGAPAVRKCSIVPLQKVLALQGVQFIPNDSRRMPFTMIGADSLEGGVVRLKNAKLSQILSALLMIAPYARNPFSFSFHKLAKKSRVEMTCEMMAEFGVIVHRIHHSQFTVPVPQRYQARDYNVEPDLTLGNYFFAAAAITGGEVTLLGIDKEKSKQTEIKFLKILETMGCTITTSDKNITVKGSTQLKGLDIELAEVSDIFFLVCALAPFMTTPTTITFSHSLKRKELKRLNAMTLTFKTLEVPFKLNASTLQIMPKLPKAGMINIKKHYRLGMALAIMGLRVPGMGIENAQSITNINPHFFSLWNTLIEQTLSIQA